MEDRVEIGVSLLWKVGLYNLEMISLQKCNFWTGELAYNILTNLLDDEEACDIAVT